MVRLIDFRSYEFVFVSDIHLTYLLYYLLASMYAVCLAHADTYTIQYMVDNSLVLMVKANDCYLLIHRRTNIKKRILFRINSS